MPHDLLPVSRYDHLLPRLRAGQPLEMGRAVLEVCFGLWSTEPELCEDGRATLLARLPSGGGLYLTRTGEILTIGRTGREDSFRAQLFTGAAEDLWRAVAIRHPGVIPGGSILSRYWVLRENVSPMVSTYARFDLLWFEALERAADREAIARRVEAANSAVRPAAAVA